jgi:hypothetical protein
MNGASINPIDSKVYAIAKMSASNDNAYLVRFDNDAFEYVAKLRRYSFSATFDRVNGDFFLIDQNDGNRKLYRYSDVHTLPGFTNKGDVDLTNTFDNATFVYDYSSCTNATGDVLDKSCDGSGEQHEKFADLAPLSANLEGIEGNNQDYMISIGSKNSMLVIEYTGTTYRHWLLKASVSGSGTLSQNNHKGAGWNHQDSNGNDHLYFAQNNGNGVAEVLLPTVNLTSRTVEVAILGSSVITGSNDGLNCFQSDIPFATCGDKNGPMNEPNPNAVTDDECGLGMMYNDAAQFASCAASPCNVGNSTADDQSLCCIPESTASPSAQPSASPSSEPSKEPRGGPSASPSSAPLASPSSGPSAEPSASPSASPSRYRQTDDQ